MPLHGKAYESLLDDLEREIESLESDRFASELVNRVATENSLSHSKHLLKRYTDACDRAEKGAQESMDRIKAILSKLREDDARKEEKESDGKGV